MSMTPAVPPANTLGYARLVRRRGPSFPFRLCSYFDCTKWEGGFIRFQGGPGAVVLRPRDGTMLDIASGRVYTDTRFVQNSVLEGARP